MLWLLPFSLFFFLSLQFLTLCPVPQVAQVFGYQLSVVAAGGEPADDQQQDEQQQEEQQQLQPLPLEALAVSLNPAAARLSGGRLRAAAAAGGGGGGMVSPVARVSWVPCLLLAGLLHCK